MITRKEILMGRDAKFPLTDKQESNLKIFLDRINELREIYAKPMIVTSGYRPPEINAAVGGAPKSKHLDCLAIDVADPDGSLDLWLEKHVELLEKLEFYVEHKDYTPGWAHIQLGAPISGVRFFAPNKIKRIV
jgi:Peptidase M15